MLLATVLLLCPFPQTGEAAKAAQAAADNQAVALSASTTKEASRSDSLPSAPEPKVKTNSGDTADATPGHYAAFPVKVVKAAESVSYETPAKRRAWYALSIAGSGAAAFDAWSTRRAISAGSGTEANPLLRPFAHSNAIYAVTQASPLLMDFLGKRMMVSSHPWLRRMWWLPQSAGTALSLGAGAHNVSITQ